MPRGNFSVLFTWRKVTSARRVTRCCTTGKPTREVASGQRKTHVNSYRRQTVHRGKVYPGVSELTRGNVLSRDHVNRQLDESCSSSDSDSYVYSVNNYQNEADVDVKPPANVNQICQTSDLSNVKTPVLIDTGASINLIDLKPWQQIKSSKLTKA